MIAPNGPMKFCAGRFDGDMWLKGTQEGRSFGMYEIKARKNNVPAPRKRRAKTSFHAVFLIVRATAVHSNARERPFNFIPTVNQAFCLTRRAEMLSAFLHKRNFCLALRTWRLNVEHWTIPGPSRFPACAFQTRALTVRRVMRFLLRRALLALATGLLIFCCSCERHHVGELPVEHTTKRGETDVPKPHAAPSPAARMSPANFFPDKPKP
jgi:hypothetical protein